MNQHDSTNQYTAAFETTHHATDALRCSVDGEEWPCQAFAMARRKADAKGSRLIVVEVPRSHKRKRR